jgi:hypothetical protein
MKKTRAQSAALSAHSERAAEARESVASDILALKVELSGSRLRGRALDAAERSVSSLLRRGTKRLSALPGAFGQAARRHPLLALGLSIGALAWLAARLRAKR